jgi:Leucine-rich repeat (LRR) protein
MFFYLNMIMLKSSCDVSRAVFCIAWFMFMKLHQLTTVHSFLSIQLMSTDTLTTAPQTEHPLEDLDLDLSGNALTSIPVNLALRPLLHFLDLSNNNLTELPDSLCELRSLYVLSSERSTLSFHGQLPGRS